MEEQKLKDIFQNKLAEHQSPVSPELWSQLSSQLPTAGSSAAAGGVTALSSAAKLTLAVALITAGIITTVILVNNKDQETETIETPTKEQKVEQKEVEITPDPSPVPIAESEKIIETAATKEESRSASPEKQLGSQNSQLEIPSENQSPEAEAHSESASIAINTKDQGETPASGESTTGVQQEKDQNSQRLDSQEFKASETREFSAECQVGVETPMILQYEVEGDSDFIWDFGDGNQLNGNGGSYRYSEAGRYTVTLFEVGANDQKELDSWEIIAREKPVIVLPNVFTPLSSPGSNDFYRLNQRESENITSLNLRIFSKDGELVYETDDPNFSWDGKDRFGNQLSPGTYLAVAEARNSHGDKTIEQQTIYLKR